MQSKEKLEEVIDYLVERFSHEFSGDKILQFPKFDFDYDPEDPDLIKNSAEGLIKCGCVIFRNFMPSNEARVLEKEFSAFANSVKNEVGRDDDDIEKDYFILCGKKSKYKNIKDLVGVGKPTIQTSKIHNEGMIQIFNIDNLFVKYRKTLEMYGRHKFVLDVLTMDDGPYCYAAGTYNEENVHTLNQEINKIYNRGDLVFSPFNKDRVIPLLGKKEGLIISFQNGAH